MTLDQLPLGSRARVTDLGSKRDALMIRLMEMGLVRGARVVLRKRAPFAGPLEIKLEGYLLTMRRSEASRVRVEVIESKETVEAA